MLKISQSACKRSTAGTHLVQSVHPIKSVSLCSKAGTLKAAGASDLVGSVYKHI